MNEYTASVISVQNARAADTVQLAASVYESWRAIGTLTLCFVKW